MLSLIIQESRHYVTEGHEITLFLFLLHHEWVGYVFISRSAPLIRLLFASLEERATIIDISDDEGADDVFDADDE